MIGTVYYIDSSVGEKLAEGTVGIDNIAFFSDLAIGHHMGECYLCGSIGSLRQLAKQIGGQVGGIYHTILQHYVDDETVMKTVQTVFVLTYAADVSALPQAIQGEGRHQFIRVPIAIQEHWRLRECSLLGENLEDCDFYQLVAAHYCKRHKIPSEPHFHKEGCGGNTLSNALQNCVESERRPALALVDRDQKYGKTARFPDDPKTGDTYCQAVEVSKKLDNDSFLPPHHLHLLLIHEAENLIPTQTLRELEKHIPKMKQGLDRLDSLRKKGKEEALIYYDYKNGFPYIQSPAAREYWSGILTELGGNPDTDMPPEKKLEEGSYDPYALFFPPLCSKLLTHAIGLLKESTPAIDAYLEPLWEEIGSVLLTWGFSNPPQYAS